MTERYQLILQKRIIDGQEVVATAKPSNACYPSVFGMLSNVDEGGRDGSMPYLDFQVNMSDPGSLDEADERLIFAMKADIFGRLSDYYRSESKSLRVRFAPESDYVVIVNIGTEEEPDYISTPVQRKRQRSAQVDLEC